MWEVCFLNHFERICLPQATTLKIKSNFVCNELLLIWQGGPLLSNKSQEHYVWKSKKKSHLIFVFVKNMPKNDLKMQVVFGLKIQIFLGVRQQMGFVVQGTKTTIKSV